MKSKLKEIAREEAESIADHLVTANLIHREERPRARSLILAALERVALAGETDTARLDWLEDRGRTCLEINFQPKIGMMATDEWRIHKNGTGYLTSHNKTLREAIDNAMSSTSQDSGKQEVQKPLIDAFIDKLVGNVTDSGIEEPASAVTLETQNASTSRYVVGFMFDTMFQRVVLIRKNKPAWQAGKLNGVGGKIEAKETPGDAMQREFFEEAGRHVAWLPFCVMGGTNNDGGSFELHCFWTSDRLSLVRSQESETIEIIDVEKLSEREDRIGNLAWLVELARDFGCGVFPPRIVNAHYGPSVGPASPQGAALISEEQTLGVKEAKSPSVMARQKWPSDAFAVWKQDHHQGTCGCGGGNPKECAFYAGINYSEETIAALSSPSPSTAATVETLEKMHALPVTQNSSSQEP